MEKRRVMLRGAKGAPSLGWVAEDWRPQRTATACHRYVGQTKNGLTVRSGQHVTNKGGAEVWGVTCVRAVEKGGSKAVLFRAALYHDDVHDLSTIFEHDVDSVKLLF